jgi:hypothetical protein
MALILLSRRPVSQRLLNGLYIPAGNPCLASVRKYYPDRPGVAEIKRSHFPDIDDLKAADPDKMSAIQFLFQLSQELAGFVTSGFRADGQFPVFGIYPDQIILSKQNKRILPVGCYRRILIFHTALDGIDDSFRELRLPVGPDDDFRFPAGRIRFQANIDPAAQSASPRLISIKRKQFIIRFFHRKSNSRR